MSYLQPITIKCLYNYISLHQYRQFSKLLLLSKPLVWVLNLEVVEIGNKHFICISQEEDAEVEAKYAIAGQGIIHKLQHSWGLYVFRLCSMFIFFCRFSLPTSTSSFSLFIWFEILKLLQFPSQADPWLIAFQLYWIIVLNQYSIFAGGSSSFFIGVCWITDWRWSRSSGGRSPSSWWLSWA
jgi:hypothetical protein